MDIGTTPTLQSHKYGTFTAEQIEEAINGLRKKIFFLLLLADPESKAEYELRKYDIEEVFDSLVLLMDGLNSLFDYPGCLVTALGMLEQARVIYSNSDGGFISRTDHNFKTYKSLVLGAGNEILKIKGGDMNA